jgi:hypothetical protein
MVHRHAYPDGQAARTVATNYYRVIFRDLKEIVMSALTDLQNADQSLKNEVATFLTDVATALSGDNPPIEQVVSDINAEVSQLQAADPETGTSTPPPSS